MTNQRILRIAVPSIISNITVPLLGLVDVTIVGHLGTASYIGAIAVGGMLFSMIYWIFGFLRMGTGGLTSQAYGRHDLPEVTRLLMRSLSISLLLAFLLLVLQYPIRAVAFLLIDASPELPISYVHSHYTERGEHRRQPFLRICSRHEGRRSGTGHPDSSICRSDDGLPALAALLPVIAQVCSINPTII